jgi:hypothetical protein
MSNHLAIATVTAALGQLVHAAAQGSGVGAVGLKFGRPTAPASQSERKVHVYLYQVAPNGALRNADTPTRDAAGRLTQRPRAALDLFYLVSFFGDADTLEPDRMLGATVRDLHARPLLNAQAITDAIASRPALSRSDLAAAVERVKFTPIGMTLDELSRLWSVMTQTPHALSVAYQAAVVLIETEEPAPIAAPVLRRGPDDRGVTASLGATPAIAGTWIGTPDAFARTPRPPSFPNARLGLRLAIRASHLGGEAVALRFAHPRQGTFEVAIPPGAIEGDELHLDLSLALAGAVGWCAGVYAVTLAVTRGGETRISGAVPLALAPRLTSIAPSPAARDGVGAVSLSIGCEPPLRAGQQPRLLLEGLEAALEPLAADSASLLFAIADAPALSDALVRLRVVDGASGGGAATSVDSMPFAFDAGAGRFGFDPAQRLTIT